MSQLNLIELRLLAHGENQINPFLFPKEAKIQRIEKKLEALIRKQFNAGDDWDYEKFGTLINNARIALAENTSHEYAALFIGETINQEWR